MPVGVVESVFVVEPAVVMDVRKCKTIGVVVAVGVRNAEYERLSMVVGWRQRQD